MCQMTDPPEPCGCLLGTRNDLTLAKELGLDSRFAEVSLFVCPRCGQHWLRYFYELEAFTASGRWYLGAITREQAAALSADDAQATLEALDGYFYGGSYFGGRSGKAAGKIYP